MIDSPGVLLYWFNCMKKEPVGNVFEPNLIVEGFPAITRDIPSFPYYYADSDGNIWREDHVNPLTGRRLKARKLKAHHDRHGYLEVDAGTRKSAHSLVAEAFHGPRPEGFVVDHINGVRDDNRPGNLRYITQQQNLRSTQSNQLVFNRETGVSETKDGKWLAQIENNWQLIVLGTFDTREEALIARLRAEADRAVAYMQITG